MADITEYGETLINAYMDEWGFRKIDTLMEDGRRVLIVVAPPPPVAVYRIIGDGLASAVYSG